MSILCDKTIRRLIESGELVIDPFDPDRVQPASYDVTLGSEFKGIICKDTFIRMNTITEYCDLPPCYYGEQMIWSHQFLLATTLERVKIPNNVCARIEGKSSLGRLGLCVHVTAGYIDPGFEGNITLELFNCAPLPIVLTPGMKIAQISFHSMDEPAERPYGHPDLGSKYQGQIGVTESRMHENYKEDK